jgi:ammonia channel protein AmtB
MAPALRSTTIRPGKYQRRHFRVVRRRATTLGWTVVVTGVLLKLVGLFVPIRVSLQQELEGLDISQHGETLQYLSYYITLSLPAR